MTPKVMRSLRGELALEQEPLARHTSWRVGGPARRFYRPADAADLVAFLLDSIPEEPLLWLGLGSNLLVDDVGFPGTVIQTQGCLVRLERRGQRGIYTESGVSMRQGRPLCGAPRPRWRRVPGRHPRHHGRRAGHECRRLGR
jgi:hypothetical protein